MNKPKKFKENRTRSLTKHSRINFTNDTFPSGIVSAHWHSYYEAEILIGSGETIINGKKYYFDKATLHIMTPLDIHSITFNENSFRRYDIVFSLDEIESPIVRNYLINMHGGFIPITDENLDWYISLFNRIASLYERKGKKENYNHLIKTIEFLVMEFVNYSIISQTSQSENSVEKSNISAALSYIHKNFRNDIKLKDVATHIYLSEKYFSNFFKKETGTSFSDYITNLRIENACHMLNHTSDSIEFIAQDSGFHSPNHFHYTFKKVMKMTPAEYRKKTTECP